MSYRVAIEQVAESTEAILPHQPLWMAHWMRTNCIPTLQLHEHHNVNDDGEKDHPIIKQIQSAQISESSGSRKRPVSDIGVSDYPESRSRKFELRSGETTLNVPETAESSRTAGNTRSLVEQGDTPYTRKARMNILSLSKLSKSSLHTEHFTEASLPHLCAMLGPKGHTSSELSPRADLPTFKGDSARSHTDGKWELFANDVGLPKEQNSQSKSVRQTDENLSSSESQQFATVEAKQGSMSKLFGAKLLPIQRNDPKVSKFSSSMGDPVNLQEMTECSLRDVQTLQICTTVESVERILGGPPKFSKTTHGLLVTKKTDMNMSHRSQVIRESTISTQVNGNSFHGMLAPPSVFGSKEEKPQLVTSTHDDEGKNYASAVDFVDLHTESSSETDAMPFDAYKPRNPSAGGASSMHMYATRVQAIQEDHTTIMSLAESPEIRIKKIELPDINEEPPTGSESSSLDNRALSESGTKSLNAENLIFHAKQLEKNSGSNPQLETLPATESCSRWVMRFRLSASDSHAAGTNSWKPGDDCQSENVNKLLSRIMNYRRTSSEPTLGMHLGRESEQLGKSATSLTKEESSSPETMKDNQEISLSHPWIQRWRRGEVSLHTMKPPSVEVLCEPESSRIALDDDFQKKQFPSIAAMALMGKAVANLQPCELRKKGPFVVWKT